MQLAYQILVLVHLIGFAALFGGFLIQLRSKEPEVNAAMLHGSLTLLITGLALVTLRGDWARSGQPPEDRHQADHHGDDRAAGR